MKKTLFIISLFCITVLMQAQNIRITQDVIVGKHFTSATGDSVQGIDIAYTGSGYPGLSYGAYPDSIKIGISVTDSTGGVVAFKTQYSNARASYVTRDTIFTIKSYATAKDTGLLITKNLWLSKGQFGVSYIGTATLNGVLTTHKVWMRVERFFTASR